MEGAWNKTCVKAQFTPLFLTQAEQHGEGNFPIKQIKRVSKSFTSSERKLQHFQNFFFNNGSVLISVQISIIFWSIIKRPQRSLNYDYAIFNLNLKQKTCVIL